MIESTPLAVQTQNLWSYIKFSWLLINRSQGIRANIARAKVVAPMIGIFMFSIPFILQIPSPLLWLHWQSQNISAIFYLMNVGEVGRYKEVSSENFPSFQIATTNHSGNIYCILTCVNTTLSKIADIFISIPHLGLVKLACWIQHSKLTKAIR